MVHLEPTPAKIILDLIDQVRFKPDDIFFDLGSGLGHVTILLALLTEVRIVGVEVEASYYQHAKTCATALGVERVTFINEDAREVDYTTGTIFFMFTPFKGQILETVLNRLHQEAQARPFTLCTYGPCTRVVVDEAWLRQVNETMGSEYELAVFQSSD